MSCIDGPCSRFVSFVVPSTDASTEGAFVSIRWRYIAAGVFAAAILCFSAGCGGDAPIPVAGKVTVNGVPFGNAGVTFHPQDGKGRPATAETAEDGTYKLTTINPGDGAMKGEYRVTIVWDEPVHPYMAMRDGAPGKEALRKEYEDWKAKHQAKTSPIPQLYAAPTSTPLSQKVPAPGGIANFDIKPSP